MLFVTSLVIGFSGAITPGPLLLACMTRSARDGFRGGVLTAVGHAVLELALVVGLTLGLARVLVRPGVAPTISLLGGLFLVWIGYGILRGVVGGAVSLPGRPKARSGPGTATGAILTGVAATLSGPYWAIWWATVGLSYISLAVPLGLLGVASFYLGHVTADFVWYSAVALAVAGGRRLMTARGYRMLLAVCGVALASLGLVFALRGAGVLLRLL